MKKNHTCKWERVVFFPVSLNTVLEVYKCKNSKCQIYNTRKYWKGKVIYENLCVEGRVIAAKYKTKTIMSWNYV